jgi:hypothetical protein
MVSAPEYTLTGTRRDRYCNPAENIIIIIIIVTAWLDSPFCPLASSKASCIFP